MELDNILNEMKNLVEKNVKNYKTDFYNYDIKFYNLMEKGERFIWITRDNGTNMCRIYKDIKEETTREKEKENARLYYNHYGIENGKWMHCRYYLIEKGKGIKNISLQQFGEYCE